MDLGIVQKDHQVDVVGEPRLAVAMLATEPATMCGMPAWLSGSVDTRKKSAACTEEQPIHFVMQLGFGPVGMVLLQRLGFQMAG